MKTTICVGCQTTRCQAIGSVDISPQPDESCDKAKKAQEASVELVESGENASEMFDLAHKALDQMSFAVAALVVFAGLFAIGPGWNHSSSSRLGDRLDEGIRIIALVSQCMSEGEALDKSRSLFDVTLLTGSENEPQGISQAIYRYVDLGGKTSSAAPESLCLLSTGSFEGSGSTGMGTNNGAVKHEVLHIGIIYEMLVHSGEDTLVTPAGESFIDTVPVTEFLREQSPLSTTSCNPKECLNEKTAITFFSYVNIHTGAKELEDLQPCFIL